MSDVNVDLGSILSGLGQTAKDLREAITGDIPAAKKAELDLQAQQIDSQLMNAQTELDKIEAQNGNIFLSGWRPLIGWICAIAISLYFLIFPMVKMLFKDIELPSFDMGTLMTLVFSLLGIGTMRTIEKINNVQNKH